MVTMWAILKQICCGYFWGNFCENMGFFLIQHLVTLLLQSATTVFMFKVMLSLDRVKVKECQMVEPFSVALPKTCWIQRSVWPKHSIILQNLWSKDERFCN